MKVLVVLHDYLPAHKGGSEIHAHQVARELARRGHDVTALFTERDLSAPEGQVRRGELDGVRLLSEGAVRRASQEQNRGIGRVVPVSMRWRLGYHRVFAVGAAMPGAFGHFGFGGSGAFADPLRQLAVALTVNSGVGTPFGDSRIARVAGAAARCVDRRELR